MPNSIIQGLTTQTETRLNELNPFTTVTLLGLVSIIDQKDPGREVRATLGEILDIVTVGTRVAQAVTRCWCTDTGKTKERKYEGKRRHPEQMKTLHKALLALHEQKIIIRTETAGRRVERLAHVLDAFGYEYVVDGKPLDLDNLPTPFCRKKIGVTGREIYRLHRLTTSGERPEKPAGVVFRLNAELAREILGEQGTVRFTLIAERLFTVLRNYSRDGSAIRLLLLILRQTGETMSRVLRQAMNGLGYDTNHPKRAVEKLRRHLNGFKNTGVLKDWELDLAKDRLKITRNKEWYRQHTLRKQSPDDSLVLDT